MTMRSLILLTVLAAVASCDFVPMDMDEVDRQVSICEQRGWHPIVTINGHHYIVAVKCVPSKSHVDLAERKGWYF